jgi:cation diffusion facilitator CzcD-associated flavoprotein CzcO
MDKPKSSSRQLRIAVIGAGMAGILAAIRLKEGGRHQVVVYEKAARIGGTWRENTYPGLNCDVPAHAYTYSFAPNAEWSSFLAPGAEIQKYFEGVVDRHGVRELIRFDSEIKSCVWTDGRWHIETVNGHKDQADVVIAATGVLHHINQPRIPGLETFAGKAFHTARWDHAVPLDGRRVGIIGNGSTGVQLVSALAGRAARVTHIQRTPQWIMPMPNEPYTDEQRAAFRADAKLIDEIRYGEWYMGLVRRFTDAVADPTTPAMAEIEAIVLDNLERSVADPVLKEKLRPSYRAACKRLIYSPDYYQKVQRDDVDVVVGGIERIEPAGVRMQDGTLIELDVLALATGFDASRYIRPAVVKGRDGADLDAAWGGSPSAYLGISVPEFPNFFMLNGPTGPVGNFSLIDIAERQWGYMTQLLAELESGRAREISVSASTLDGYDRRRIAAARTSVFGSGCQSWYLDATGVPASWPWNYDAFADATATARLDEYEIRA